MVSNRVPRNESVLISGTVPRLNRFLAALEMTDLLNRVTVGVMATALANDFGN